MKDPHDKSTPDLNFTEALQWSRARHPHCEGCGREITDETARRHGHMCWECDSGRGEIAATEADT